MAGRAITRSLTAMLRARVNMVVLPQAVRLAEMVAARGRKKGSARPEVGGDMRLVDEPAHLEASDRMMAASGDIAAIDEDGGQVRITANVLGLAGATPVLPSFYSELQLQRRRLRDRSLARFLNIFDHRALSFFYRAHRKYNPLLGFEREDEPGHDPLSKSLLALSGFGTKTTLGRLSFDSVGMAPLAHYLSGSRRTAAGLAVVLRYITGLDLNVVESTATWMALPSDAQSRLGLQSSRLGGTDAASGMGFIDGAVIGAAVIDIQHHYSIHVGPLSHAELLRFCAEDGPSATIGETCLFYTGIAYRPSIKVKIAAKDIPPLQLASATAPAFLGRTSWLGSEGPDMRDDCVISVTLPVGG